eukprot:scaffold160047_cov46-Cyclotella_meneghiniana.AAC.1
MYLRPLHVHADCPGGCGPGRNGQKGQTSAQQGARNRQNRAKQGGTRQNKGGTHWIEVEQK